MESGTKKGVNWQAYGIGNEKGVNWQEYGIGNENQIKSNQNLFPTSM